jgi:hypothetical protein
MTPVWKRNIFYKIGKYGFHGLRYASYFVLFLFTFILVLAVSVPYFLDLDRFKASLVQQLKAKTDLELEFVDSEIAIFPYPGLEIEYIQIKTNETTIANLNSLTVDISLWKLLFGELEITGLSLHSGTVYLHRNRDGSFDIVNELFKSSKLNPEENQNTSEPLAIQGPDTMSVALDPETLLRLLPNRTKIDNIHFEFQDDLYQKKYKAYIWTANLESSSFLRRLSLDLYGKVNQNKIEIYSQIDWDQNDFSYESFRTKTTVLLDKFQVSLAEDILVIFPFGNFANTIISGRIHLTKSEEDLALLHLTEANITGLSLKNGQPFGDFRGSTWITYSFKEKRLGFDEIDLEWKDHVKAKGYGYLTFTEKPVVYFKAESSSGRLDSIIKTVHIWLDPKIERSPILKNLPNTGYDKKVNVILDLSLRNLVVGSRKVDLLSGLINYRYRIMQLERVQCNIYEGRIYSDGVIRFLPETITYNFEHSVRSMNVEKLIQSLDAKKYITGYLDAEFSSSSRGLTDSEWARNLKLKGNYSVKNGELLDYLNIITPIANLGKLVNFSGPPGKSTGFEKISGEFSYKNEVVTLPDIMMKGVGLNAKGSGTVGLNQLIDVRITVSLPGVTGQVVKLPIIYKGVFGKNLPYVNPVWVGSVYAGTILLAGPIGATVGGIAGSAASDYVEKGITGLRNFLRSGRNLLFGTNSEQDPDSFEDDPDDP